MTRGLLAAALASTMLAAPAIAQTPSPEGATAYIISPSDGDTVTSPVTVLFGLSGMGVAPAGVEADNTGHHHMLIDIDPSEIDLTTSLPATDQIVHFGGGQTQVTKEMPAGTHTLRILLGDWSHVPHDPPVMSDPITITVE